MNLINYLNIHRITYKIEKTLMCNTIHNIVKTINQELTYMFIYYKIKCTETILVFSEHIGTHEQFILY